MFEEYHIWDIRCDGSDCDYQLLEDGISKGHAWGIAMHEGWVGGQDAHHGLPTKHYCPSCAEKMGLTS